MADKVFCGGLRCARYEMTQLEFRRLRGEQWDQSYISRFGKTATKLYREIYGEKPKLKRSRVAKRNHVHRYPCGILEQAYRQLTEQGVPLVKPDSSLARRLERESQRQTEPVLDETDSRDALRGGSNALRQAMIKRLLQK
jgi:hypothetical protein